MVISDQSFVTGEGLLYRGVLRNVKRSKTSLQPLFEAFTNALEAIRIKTVRDGDFQGKIKIDIYTTQNTDNTLTFSKLVIQDNGIGFNEEEFIRFNTYQDFTKGFKNLGSGRIQFAHYFDQTNFKSVYKNGNGFRKREFTVSKRKEFLDKNSITYHKADQPIDAIESETTVIFNDLLDPSRNIYHNLNQVELKENLIQRYIQYFCLNKSILPQISIEHFIFEESQGIVEINSNDIPNIDKTSKITINYSKLSSNGVELVHTDESEDFIINAFKMQKSALKENAIKFTSKDEVIESFDLELTLLSKEESIDGNHFLFLVSSEYLDDRDTNERGELEIPKREDFEKARSIFSDQEILLDEIENNLNATILGLYPEIQKVKEEHQLNFQKLKDMFLLSDDFDENIKISVNDSEKKILEKFYSAEAKRSAQLDANLKDSVDRLNKLDTTSFDYPENLEAEIEKLVRFIPQQNKADLTHYVARRKLILELFQKIIDRQLITQNDGSRNNYEALLHNLIFQQSSNNPERSDLWLVNEDFIYFKGISESRLTDISIDNQKLLRDDLSNEEEEFRRSLNEDRFTKRTDILLFPQESKCIIIEFKNPDVSVSDHLNQINNYATLLRNFTVPEHKFTTFYGYLIGEKINGHDVRAHDADFKISYHFDYLFRPSKTIAGMFRNEGDDGNLYTEVLKYSTLLQRAKQRNQIFIDNLTSKTE
jgi:hypothetical protein